MAKRLSDVVQKDVLNSVYRKIDDYIMKPIFIHSCKFEETDRGTRVVFVVSEQETSAQFYLSTYAHHPQEVAKVLEQAKSYPVLGMFIREGRAIFLRDPAEYFSR